MKYSTKANISLPLSIAATMTSIIFGTTTSARAATFIYSNPSNNNLSILGTNDSVNWRNLDSNSANFSVDPMDDPKILANTFRAISNRGLLVTGSFGITARRFDQRNINVTVLDPLKWNGDFNSDEAAIASANEPSNDDVDRPGSILPDYNDLVLTFNNPVFGAGAQINTGHYGKFTGSISAYDSFDREIVTFNNSNITNDGRTTPPPIISIGTIGTDTYGQTTNDANNAAYFWGIKSDTNNISKIVFRTNRESLLDGSNTPIITYGANNFAINSLRLNIADFTAVPEPLTIVGTLIGGAMALRLRNKLKTEIAAKMFDI